MKHTVRRTRSGSAWVVAALLALVMLLSACSGAKPAATPAAAATPEPTPVAPSAPTSVAATTAAPTAAATTAEKHNYELRLGVTTTFNSTDPHYTAQNADFLLNELLYESFYDVDAELNMDPRLATSYDVSEDGLTYTYHLKANVPFQTGGTLTAADVVYSIERAQKSPYMASYLASVDKVEAVDDLTVKFTLKNVDPVFYININRVAILSQAATKDLPTGFSNAIPGGTGPFTITAWDPSQKVVVTRFDKYHGNPASMKTMTFTVFGDTNAVLRAFEAGELDFATVMGSDWDRIKSSGKYKTFIQDSTSTLFLSMNNEKKPFDDVRVRQAFNYAVNKDDMLYAALDGNGRVLHTLGNPTMVFGVPKEGEIFQYTYDPAKAKELLKEAGYPNGLTLKDPILTLGSDEFSIPAQVLQSQLAAVGIKAEVQTMEQSAYISDMISGNYTLGIMALSLDIDASQFALAYTTKGINALNLARYSNKTVDDLFDKASKTLNQDERKAYFKQAYDQASKDAAYLPIYSMQIPIASDKDLESTIYKSYYYWSWN